MTTDPDQPLVQATLQGDLRAFDTLVERHRDVVFRVTARIVGSDEEAEDVTQDAFLRAFHRLERYRGEAPFRTWLLRIAHNTAVTHVTQSGRRATHPLGAVDEDVAHAVAHGSPAEQLERRERLARLDTKVKAPEPGHRTVLVLRDIEGLSYDEIARMTDARSARSRPACTARARSSSTCCGNNTYDWELPR